ncbi:MAG: FAD-dependent oxidoreductase [Acidobacteriota bacterium]
MSNGNDASSKGNMFHDVAIVGGGVSGIYSGWRLVTANAGDSERLKAWAGPTGKLKVTVFEGSDRIGGRLLSARAPGLSTTTTCEIGGMRYVSSQTIVRSLVENELKLPHYEQVVNQPNNVAYLRGKHLRFSQIQDPAALPYDLNWAEAQYVLKNDPSGLMIWAAAKLLPGILQFKGDDLHKYLRSADVDGTGLYQHGFWSLVMRGLTEDAYNVARCLVGYDCLGSNGNAVDLIAEFLDFTPEVTYSLLNDGYETVPWTLQKRFEAAGGAVKTGVWLTGFEATTLDDGSQGVQLHFTGGRPSEKARVLILAMPQRSLELLSREGPLFAGANASAVQHLVNSVQPISLFKLFLQYRYPWWTSVGVSQGRSLTDLPVRQLYYWPIDPLAAKPPTSGDALLMAYDDATNVDFWAGLRRVSRPLSPHAQQHFRRVSPSGIPTFTSPEQTAVAQAASSDDVFGQRLLKNWRDHEAPRDAVREVHRQVKRMHNIEYAPEPCGAAYMDWSEDPFGGGVHFWNPGYRSWEVLEQMTQPVADFPCYVCGEAYSTNQTWVEGALQTAEIVLQKHFNLGVPSWITKA